MPTKGGNKWFKFTIFYAVIETLIAIGIIVMGIIFERSIVGYIFSPSQQQRFAHLILSYGCLTLIFPSVLSIALLCSYVHVGFIVLGLTEVILSILAIVTGVYTILSPTKILQHGFIDQFIGSNQIVVYIIGGVCGLYGVWLFGHAISTFLKASQLRYNEKLAKRQALNATTLSKKQSDMKKMQKQNGEKNSQKNDKSEKGEKDEKLVKENQEKNLGTQKQPEFDGFDGNQIDLEGGSAFATPATPSKKAYNQNNKKIDPSPKKSEKKNQHGNKNFTEGKGDDAEMEENNGQERVFDMNMPLSPMGMTSDDEERGRVVENM